MATSHDLSTRDMPLLDVSDLSKHHPNGPALDGVSFSLPYLSKLAIAGETGSGKSTLLKIIAGLLQTDDGEALFEGVHVKGPYEQLIAGHRSIAYLSQQYELRNNYRVEELMEMASLIPESEAEVLFSICRISHLLKRKTSDLSGGEKQRIALARLLVTTPKLLVLDEPFSNLDPIHKRVLKEVLTDISTALKITCILASHDPLDTLSWADDMLVLRAGKIVQRGSPAHIYSKPSDEYVAGIIGAYQLLSHEEAAQFGVSHQPPDAKCLLVRPEQFRIVKDNANALPGIVVDKTFLGSHYELQIQLQFMNIMLLYIGSPPQVGDAVYVNLSTDNIHYI